MKHLHSGLKSAVLAVALAASMFAADAPKVLVTPGGKTYHSQKCLALSRSKVVYSVTLDAAKAHNLKPCGICYRAKSEKKADTKSAWMKESK